MPTLVMFRFFTFNYVNIHSFFNWFFFFFHQWTYSCEFTERPFHPSPTICIYYQLNVMFSRVTITFILNRSQHPGQYNNIIVIRVFADTKAKVLPSVYQRLHRNLCIYVYILLLGKYYYYYYSKIYIIDRIFIYFLNI